MYAVIITVISLLYLMILWIMRFKKLTDNLKSFFGNLIGKKSNKVLRNESANTIIRLIKIMIIDGLFLSVTLALLGPTNFGIMVSALINMISSIILPLMIKE